jgi:ATP-dependent RNA helicase HelY
VRSREETLAGYTTAMTCHLGDFSEYADLRRQLKDAEHESANSRSRQRRHAAAGSLERLRRGDIVEVPGGRNEGYAVILETDFSGLEPRPSVLTMDKQIRRLSVHDFDGPVEVVSSIRVPKSFNERSPKSRRDLASSVRNALHEHRPPRRGAEQRDFVIPGSERYERRIAELRRKLKSHPCHGCSEREDHARWAERWFKLRRETDQLVAQIQGRTNTIAKTFDRVCEVLSAYDYLEAQPHGEVAISPAGNRLRRIYGDRDLLVALCLERGAFDDLDAAEVAAFASVLVYQSKREEAGIRPRMPAIALETSVETAVQEWAALTELEERHRLPLSSEPEFGLVWPIYKWARGRGLQAALQGTDLAAGDFVRWAKQVIDLLDQLAKVPGLDQRIAGLCREAIRLIRRGVVAYSGISD